SMHRRAKLQILLVGDVYYRLARKNAAAAQFLLQPPRGLRLLINAFDYQSKVKRKGIILIDADCKILRQLRYNSTNIHFIKLKQVQ
ncbi:hypothetical protein LXA28_18480, partial [Erwinia amylovora]